MINGIINIYKESGYTSHDVVAKLRGILKQKKVGHTGTLDPEATGVLPVCLGSATKLCDMITDTSKEYEVKMQLGITTDTLDLSGTISSRSEVTVSEKEIEKTMLQFVGGYDQIPPMYSALKVNGKKLYELAREGKEIERKPRRVELPYIKILEMELPYVRYIVGCSKGTYVRSLCADIGEQLGCGAAMAELKRTKVGNFFVEESITLDQIAQYAAEGRLEQYVFASDRIVIGCNGATVKPKAERFLLNGNKLYFSQLDMENEAARFTEGDLLRVYMLESEEQRELKAVYQYISEENCFKPFKMLL